MGCREERVRAQLSRPSPLPHAPRQLQGAASPHGTNQENAGVLPTGPLPHLLAGGRTAVGRHC